MKLKHILNYIDVSNFVLRIYYSYEILEIEIGNYKELLGLGLIEKYKECFVKSLKVINGILCISIRDY